MDVAEPTAEREDGAPSGLRGSLPDFPDLAWEDFERASELARRDVGAGRGSVRPS